MNKNFQFDIDVITNLSKENDLIKIYKSFNIKNFYILQIKIKLIKYNLLIRSLFCFILSIFKILFFGENRFIKEFSINKVYIGDLIYDHFIRHDLTFLKSSLINKKFLNYCLSQFMNFFILKN